MSKNVFELTNEEETEEDLVEDEVESEVEEEEQEEDNDEEVYDGEEIEEDPSKKTVTKDLTKTNNQDAVKKEVEAYKSSYKYKVKNKEYEVDEMLKPLIKDKESEAKIIDLLTSAKGLDEVKESKRKIEEEYGNVKKQFVEYKSRFEPAETLYKQGNKFEAVLSVFPAEDIIHVAEQLRRYQEMDDDQKRMFDNSVAGNYERYKVNQERSMESETVSELKRKNVELEISHTMYVNNDAREMAEWYDSVYGEGEFKKEVYKYGNEMYNELGRSLPPSEVVVAVSQRLAKLRNVATSSQGSTINNQSPSRKDRIPSARSAGSVVKKVSRPKDFQEAIKLAREEEDEDI